MVGDHEPCLQLHAQSSACLSLKQAAHRQLLVRFLQVRVRSETGASCTAWASRSSGRLTSACLEAETQADHTKCAAGRWQPIRSRNGRGGLATRSARNLHLTFNLPVIALGACSRAQGDGRPLWSRGG